jgi:hypothetical protein
VEREAPEGFRLQQNYPNPFNPSTEIVYEIDHPTHVALRIYNLLGEVVATPVDAPRSPGTHRIRFDAHGLPSGVYFYRLDAGDAWQIRRMVLAK